MIRVIAGRAKGRKLVAPEGLETRPTGARVRQTLFDILAPRIAGARFLDLCAGAGAVGFEALSRGASRVVLVDSSPAAVRALKANAEALRSAGGDVAILRQDARRAIASLADEGRSFELVFLDPPYQGGLYEEVLAGLGESPLLAEHGLVVAQHFKKHALPETIAGLSRSRAVRVGDHQLSFYGRAATPERGA
jgi:16S rRNA (guanine(966)-N(2))-methyltransferase RsmD